MSAVYGGASSSARDGREKFHSSRKSSRRSRGHCWTGTAESRTCARTERRRRGALLASFRRGASVIKPAIVWIVLALAAAPSASVLCRIDCDTQAHPPSGCHHQHTLARFRAAISTSGCNEMAMTDAPFVRDEVRRRTAIPHSGQSPLATAVYLADGSRQSSLASAERLHHAGTFRPPLTTLRI